MPCFEKDFTVKVEKEQYEDTCIPNFDVKQEFIDVNVIYNKFSKCRYTLLEAVLLRTTKFY